MTGPVTHNLFDCSTAEAAAPGTTPAPALQADPAAAMATMMEVETAPTVCEEQLPQVAVHHVAEVSATDVPVTASENSAAVETTAR